MPVFKIQHITKYSYNRPVKESINQIRIYPIASDLQEILQHDVRITSDPDLFFFIDYWGNRCADFSLLHSHIELTIDSRIIVRTIGAGFVPAVESNWNDLAKDVQADFFLLELTRPDQILSNDDLQQIIDSYQYREKSIMQIVEACSGYIFREFKYIKGITTIESTVDDILKHRSGVCQDFAHVLLQLLHIMGIPSRYVSGYICPNKNGMRGEGATHAWVEAWIPKLGWAGIDPTNNVWATTHHIKLAAGRNFNDCTPVKGTFKGVAKQTLSVYVSVGYEDGQVFEEVNNVQMHISGETAAEQIVEDEVQQ